MSYPQLVKEVLEARGITAKEDAEEFFTRSYDVSVKDPFVFSAMRTIVDRLLRAVEHHETVGIYSDFDQDGIPGLVILTKALKTVGSGAVVWYVPDRRTETHGFHTKGADELLQQGASVIVVIDCGINDTDAIQHAQERGADVIILDHHTPNSVDSPAFAVLNPLCEEDPKRVTPLCGAGCAFKVAHALFLETQQPIGSEKWLLDLTGLATVADRVPLVGENRVFAYVAPTVLKKTKHTGLSEIRKRQKMTDGTDITHLSIRFSAYINSATREGKTKEIVQLLLADDEQTAKHCADICDRAVKNSRSVEGKITRICNKIAATKQKDRDVWVFGDRSWPSSLAGFIAQKMATQHNKTVFVWGANDTGLLTGSARTALRHNVLDMMHQTAKLYEQYGGHIPAAGFTLKPGVAVSFEDALNTITPKVIRNEHVTVFKTTLEDLTSKTCQLLYDCAPFGTANEQPCVELEAKVTQQRRFGKNNNHLSYTLSDGVRAIEVIAYASKEDAPVGENVCVQGYIDKDAYNNRYCLLQLTRT